ncbi:MAG TPA: extracellular solute-binding protein [Solirubrobacter sp.]|nr:extracellular solute-binding protein [Solirubrobacter sp.]
MAVRWTRKRLALLGGAVLIVIALLAVAAFALTSSADIVVYNGRSQYGDEQAFKAFEKETGLKVELRGGTAPELFERLRREGAETPADLLVTTDLANLWRAKDAGLLEPVTTPALEKQVPERLHDPDGAWWGLSTRIRTPMRSTVRVPADAVTSYEDLGKPQFRGKLCLRTSNNEYNQSFVADRIAKYGEAETEELLRSWMANEPRILGSDVDVLEAINAGRCDVGLTNHYYLGRELKENPKFAVAPAWPDQDGAGAHTNLSGVGLVKGAEHRANAIRLMEFLTAREAQEAIVENSEFAVNPDVPPAAHIRDWAGVKTDPIDVERAGELLETAVALMQRVGWK